MLVLSALLREGPLYSRTLSGASYYVVSCSVMWLVESAPLVSAPDWTRFLRKPFQIRFAATELFYFAPGRSPFAGCITHKHMALSFDAVL